MMEYNEEFTEYLEDYIKENYEVYDRFTFDYLFRNLLQDGYDHEEAKDIITHNCALSTLVMQERIYNGYYLKISVNEQISDDLLKLISENFNKYFKNAKQKKRDGIRITREYITELGISEVVQNELESVTEEECIDYAYNLVLNRTYEGYMTEIQTIYGQLQNILGIQIKPAPDEWDRRYNVDFFIEINGKYIGLQIKPTTFEHTFEDYKWKEMQETSQRKFQEKFGGKVFIVFSVKEGKKKVIHNPEVIEEIRKEIEKLEKE
ncbi:MAG: MjaI family restriction endonuclease [Euryarchaeota archaeon]|nr:MjaI family restriction endonuclease [Euryarchaeota archaeon]